MSSLGVIKNALIAVANERASIGAGINRLQSAVQVMQSQALNTQSAESTVRDANMATGNFKPHEISNSVANGNGGPFTGKHSKQPDPHAHEEYRIVLIPI